jgi:hypothetical protein
MSASREGAHDLRRGDSVLPRWVKEAVRATLRPIVGLAMALHLTPNTITVIGVFMPAMISTRRSVLGARPMLAVSPMPSARSREHRAAARRSAASSTRRSIA